MTIINERDLVQRPRTRPRDGVTKRKVGPNRPWHDTGQLSARYITATLPGLSKFSLPPPSPSRLPYFLSVLDNANNTTVDKGTSDRKALSLRIWSGLTFDQREHQVHEHQRPVSPRQEQARKARTGPSWITTATAPLRYRLVAYPPP